MADELRYHPNSLVVGLISVQIHLKYRRECQGCCLWLKDVECYHLNDVLLSLMGENCSKLHPYWLSFLLSFMSRIYQSFLLPGSTALGI